MSERISQTTSIRWDLDFKLTVSVTDTRFREALRDKKLTGTRCSWCGWIFVPPRPYCERCCEPANEWVDVADTGTLVSFTEVHIAARNTPTPFVLGVIRLDGVDGLFLHHIGVNGVTSRAVPDLNPGQRLAAVWRQETRGEILDIEYFRPVCDG